MPPVPILHETILANAALTTDTGVPFQTIVGAGKCSRVRQFTAYVTARGTLTGGKVKIFSAPNAEYTGTWALEGSEVTLASDSTAIVRFLGPVGAVKAVVSTNLAGTAGDVKVDVVLVGN